MNIQVLSDEKKPFFKRREIKAKLGYDNKTPSRLDIRKELAKKLNVKEELVVVRKIEPDFGTPAAKLEVSIYDNQKALEELESEYMVDRHSVEKKKKEVAPETPTAPAAPAEAPKEGKPAEIKTEKKEEAKPEAKEEKKAEDKPKKEKK